MSCLTAKADIQALARAVAEKARDVEEGEVLGRGGSLSGGSLPVRQKLNLRNELF